MLQRAAEDRNAMLDELGLKHAGRVHWNLSAPALYEEAVRRGEGTLAVDGPLVVSTGKHTGRSANDKFVVRDAETEALVNWGDVNKPMSAEQFRALRGRVLAYLQGRELFVQELSVGADPAVRLPVRVVTERAWHSLFAQNMFLGKFDSSARPFTVLHAPGFHANPDTDGTRSGAFVVLDFTGRTILIGGTEYAGEIKKSMFTVMNYLLPQQQVMSMHCSANVGAGGDVAVFFGLSGTGKTTLSADPERSLVGDDEHGWSDRGVFNLEGGCYAKVIRLSKEAEPEIFETTRRFGTVLENVVIDPLTRRLDLDDDRLTENTRASYTLAQIPNMVVGGQAGIPKNVIFLTCDAFGVLPPISRLTPAQAMYHFLSGYTAKVAGTELGVTEPRATFSTCFGAPFMPMHPSVYAKLLGERLAAAGARAWLLNTGWSGGGYGSGQRMKIAFTRSMVRAALSGALDDVQTTPDPFFGVGVPHAVPDVPADVLVPRNTWKDKAAYDAQAKKLAGMFEKNFQQYASGVTPDVRAAGPKG
ncbi:MAG TPA: phosphoenolpyruvate carboxykinase (ATP) [Polyangia bacterium]|nr:phosphoenolpyruvate carboxykinase (ATP) [Polyangia bacterium]